MASSVIEKSLASDVDTITGNLNEFKYVKSLTATSNTLVGNGTYLLVSCTGASTTGGNSFIFSLFYINGNRYAILHLGTYTLSGLTITVADGTATFSGMPNWMGIAVYRIAP